MRIEPPPSVPSAKGSRPAATAAAPPPEEPPGLRARSNGLRVAPKSLLSVVPRKPITGLLVLPTTIAPPASSMRSQKPQRAGIENSRRAGMPPKVAGQPGLKSKRSFRAVGTPCSGPSGSPSLSARCAACARSRASSKFV